jgi:hypothetical protein
LDFVAARKYRHTGGLGFDKFAQRPIGDHFIFSGTRCERVDGVYWRLNSSAGNKLARLYLVFFNQGKQ